MREVFCVVEWIDGIPELIRVYADREAAEQFVTTLARRTMQVLRHDVF